MYELVSVPGCCSPAVLTTELQGKKSWVVFFWSTLWFVIMLNTDSSCVIKETTIKAPDLLRLLTNDNLNHKHRNCWKYWNSTHSYYCLTKWTKHCVTLPHWNWGNVTHFPCLFVHAPLCVITVYFSQNQGGIIDLPASLQHLQNYSGKTYFSPLFTFMCAERDVTVQIFFCRMIHYTNRYLHFKLRWRIQCWLATRGMICAWCPITCSFVESWRLFIEHSFK